MKKSLLELSKKSLLLLGTIGFISGCSLENTLNDHDGTKVEQVEEQTTDQILANGSPWATTGVYLQFNGKTDKSINFISDSNISAGTISSAQYRNGMFMFIGMSDYATGAFNQASLITSVNDVINNNANPAGFSHGDYEIIRDGEGNTIRRISNASFAPDSIIDRSVTVATDNEFGYTFTAANGETYYVEHKPYQVAFPGTTFPSTIQTAVNKFFTSKLTEPKLADYVLKTTSPWATTAIYLQVNGQADTSTNLIDDSTISAGTISSAQYRDGMFIFVGMNDYKKGEFNEQSLIATFDAVINNGTQPNGFSYGDYQIISDQSGNTIRRISNASFAPNAIIDRTVTEATATKFTYTFVRDGETYYVEHQPYSVAFPKVTFPQALHTAIDKFFTAQ